MKNEAKTPIAMRKAKKSALLLAFPSKAAFLEFRNSDRSISEQAVPAFIRFAHQAELITSASEEAFITFIENHSAERPSNNGASNLSFEQVIDTIKGKMSVNALVDRINRHTRELKMPTVHASMITNLKKNFKSDSPKKRALLRMLAFWIGLNRPNYPLDYTTITHIPGKENMSVPRVRPNAGVRMDITFRGREGIVRVEMIDWLKKEIPKCIEDLNLYPTVGRAPEFNSATTATLEIPNHAGNNRDPWLYCTALRACLAIAHQISMRWLLSDVNIEKQSTMMIAIAAGPFSEIHAVMPHILGKELPGHPSIRVNEFAYLIANMTDIKVVFDGRPITLTLTSNSTTRIWIVKNFWFLYYDIIPNLLAEDMLPRNKDQYRQFKNELHFSPKAFSTQNTHKILSAIRQVPQNQQLIIEVAKVLKSRCMFAEANTVATMILASNPYDVMTRVFRIQLIINMGMQHTDYRIFNAFFKQAVQESRFIRQHCAMDDEVWSDIGLMYAAKAYYILKALRSNKPPGNAQHKELNPENILLYLEKAEQCLQEGITHSPLGHRSYFWIINLRWLKTLILKNPQLVTSQNPIVDPENLHGKIAFQHLAMLGWFGPGVSMDTHKFDPADIQALIRHFRKAAENRITASHCRSYRAGLYYAICVVLWDVCPIMTTGIVLQVLEWLEEACKETEQLARHGLGVYSIVNMHSLISPDHYIRCLDKTIATITRMLNEELRKDENHIIDKKKVKGLRLITMHFDEIINSGPLFTGSDS